MSDIEVSLDSLLSKIDNVIENGTIEEGRLLVKRGISFRKELNESNNADSVKVLNKALTSLVSSNKQKQIQQGI